MDSSDAKAEDSDHRLPLRHAATRCHDLTLHPDLPHSDTDPIIASDDKARPDQNAIARQQSPFELAHTYLKRYKKWMSNDQDAVGSHEDFSESFVCKVSKIEWLRLRSEFNLNEEGHKLPRLSYNSAESTFTVDIMPSIVHECVVGFLHRNLTLAVEAMQEPLRSEISLYTNLLVEDFSGRFADSEKIPDLVIHHENADGEQEIKCVLEVGVSQKYEQLQQDITFWLDGTPTCKKAVLISITESPKYKCPLKLDPTICDKLGIAQQPQEIRGRDFIVEGEYGPVTYKGYQWAGRISEAFMEVWTRNPVTKKPEREDIRVPIIPSPDRYHLFRLDDFIDIGLIDPQMTMLDWAMLRNKLKGAIKNLAMHRYRQWLRDSRKLAGSGNDKAHKLS